MATKKAAPKKAPVKKTTVKKKTTTTKASRAKASKPAEVQSFRVASSNTPFLTIAITRQTLYWFIIAAAVLALGLWVINLHTKVNEIYDSIEANQALQDTIPHSSIKTPVQTAE